MHADLVGIRVSGIRGGSASRWLTRRYFSETGSRIADPGPISVVTVLYFRSLEGLRGIRHSNRTQSRLTATGRQPRARRRSSKHIRGGHTPGPRAQAPASSGGAQAPARARRCTSRHDPRGECEPRARERRGGAAWHASRPGFPRPPGSCWRTTAAGRRDRWRPTGWRRRSNLRACDRQLGDAHRRGVTRRVRRRAIAGFPTAPRPPRWVFRSRAGDARWGRSSRSTGCRPATPTLLPADVVGAARRIEPGAIALESALRMQRAEALSVTDDLTQLYNSRYLSQVLRRETKRASRSGRPLSLCSSISTASSRSTTRTDTCSAAARWSKPPASFAPARARPTWWRASAATNLR